MRQIIEVYILKVFLIIIIIIIIILSDKGPEESLMCLDNIQAYQTHTQTSPLTQKN